MEIRLWNFCKIVCKLHQWVFFKYHQQNTPVLRTGLTSAETSLTVYWVLPTTPINHGIFLSFFLIYYLRPELTILYKIGLNSESKITPQTGLLFGLKTKYHTELQNEYTITKEIIKQNHSFSKNIIF